jgi:hypothetical protein
MTDFAMFTAEGNQLVARIATAGRDLAAVDGPQNPTELAVQWAFRELDKLGAADGYEEATDTAVREAVYSFIVEDDEFLVN